MTQDKLNLENINSQAKENYSKFVLDSENKYRNQILNISKKIKDSHGQIRFVLIAGPSSSGKTTTSKILEKAIENEGFDALALSIDDFFVEREETPKWENGEYNFETADAVDWTLMAKCLSELIKGKEVLLPTFNFLTGKKEFNTKKSIDENTIIVIEGLHALNPILDNIIPVRQALKVYISTNTNIYYNNKLYYSNEEIRLYRRIIRDLYNRGASIDDTLKIWERVRNGERLYIDPFVETAEYTVNTFHDYELCVYKDLFLNLKNDTKSFKDIVTKLTPFEDIHKSAVPNDSLLNEFIPQN